MNRTRRGPELQLETLDRTSKAELARFIRVAWNIYAGDPAWVPPLIADEVTILSPDGPFFEHADGQLTIALRDGVPVGRIAALDDAQALEKGVGRIGFFECQDDPEAALALFGQAEQWLASRGRGRARGPISPNLVWSSPGVFVDGEPGRPNAFLPYTAQWYPRLWESCGYTKEMDVLALRTALSSLPLHEMASQIDALRQEGYTFRPLSKKRLERDLAAYVRLRNSAYVHSTPYCFSQVTPREGAFLLKIFGPALDPDFVTVVEKGAEIVGMAIGFLDVGTMLQALDGRLGPVRLIRALLAKRRIRRARLAEIVTSPDQRNKKLMLTAAMLVLSNMKRRGIEEVEGSWVLETNTASLRWVNHFEMKPYRRYRIYGKALHDAA
jgi:hypothetical protein